MQIERKFGVIAVIAAVVLATIAVFVFMPKDAEARPFDGYGDFGQPAIIAAFYLNEAGSVGVTNDMWGASIANVRLNYRFLSMAGPDKVMYSVWRTRGACDISNPSMSGDCIPGTMMKMLSEDVTEHDGVEAEEYNRTIFGSPYTDGTYVTIMSVTTKEGYINSTVAKWFGIDQTAPVAPTLLNPVNGSTHWPGDTQFEWSTTDDDIWQYEIVIDQNAAQVVTGTTFGADLGEGLHTWKVRAFDKVGNTGPWSNEWTVTKKYKEDDEVIDDTPKDEDKDQDESDEEKTLPSLPAPTSGPGNSEPTIPVSEGQVGGAVTPAIASSVAADEVEATEQPAEEEAGEVLGAESEDLSATAADQVDNEGFLGLLKSWLFWLIAAVVAGFIIWVAWKRRKDEKKEVEIKK